MLQPTVSMTPPRDNSAWREGRLERLEKIIGLAALGLAIELVLFKFVPDLGTAALQHSPSSLANRATFVQTYLVPGSVFYPRFLGNWLLYWLATHIAPHVHSNDIRLNPLRIAAALLTPLYAYLGLYPVLARSSDYSWRYFLVLYGLAALIGLYVFYPGDMPAYALLSLTLFCILEDRLALALVLMLITGLFRESSFHAVWFVMAWAACARARPLSVRLGWVGAFAVAFCLEYLLIRHYFPGPVSSAPGGFNLSFSALFLDKGMLSLTTICSLGLAALFPIECLVELRRRPSGDWRTLFFRYNCYVFPAWLIFYRLMNGNLAEFRLLLPALLPCAYGAAFAARTSVGSTVTT